MSKPDFLCMWATFRTHPACPTLKDLFTRIGGELANNIDVPGFGANRNTCAVRTSMALNYGSAPISKAFVKANSLSALTSADGKLYLFRGRELKTCLVKALGAPLADKKAPSGDTFVNKRGIVTMDVKGWGNASGQVAIWSGKDFREPAFDNYLNLVADPKTAYAGKPSALEGDQWAQGLVEFGQLLGTACRTLNDLAKRPPPKTSTSGTPMLLQNCVAWAGSPTVKSAIQKTLIRRKN